VPGDAPSITAWQEIGSDRSRDADTLWSGKRTLAAAYLQWYAVECLAKALVVAAGRKPPRGNDGHDIGAILDLAGLGRGEIPADLRDHYERRSVAMRYQLESSRDFNDEFHAATQLARRLTVRVVRHANRTSRRGSRHPG
jgi:hypothetical protein